MIPPCLAICYKYMWFVFPKMLKEFPPKEYMKPSVVKFILSNILNYHPQFQSLVFLVLSEYPRGPVLQRFHSAHTYLAFVSHLDPAASLSSLPNSQVDPSSFHTSSYFYPASFHLLCLGCTNLLSTSCFLFPPEPSPACPRVPSRAPLSSDLWSVTGRYLVITLCARICHWAMFF